MKPIRHCSAPLLALLFFSSAPLRAPAHGATFIGFKDFVAGVARADSARYLGSAGARVESKEAFEQMRHHILWMYEGVQATHSFILDSQYVDCIPIMQQPSVRHLGLTELAPPPPHKPASRGPQVNVAPSPLELDVSDRFGNPIRCDVGTIPMQRITLEVLSQFRNLREFFRKDGNGPAPSAPSYQDYKYAVAGNSVNAIGAQTYLNVWYPDTTSGAEHTLSEMWILNYAPPPYTLQSAEVGWVGPRYYQGSIGSSLFIYYTADAYASTGCWNLSCPGFVQTSNTVVFGAPAWPGPSTPGGQQIVFNAEWYLYGGNWWLSHNCDACFLGYYPAQIYNGGPLPTFSNKIQFGGESLNRNGNNFPPMGSGQFAGAGLGYAAYQNGINYWDTAGHIHQATLQGSAPSPSCFTISCQNPSCNYFFFGGPGGYSCPNQ